MAKRVWCMVSGVQAVCRMPNVAHKGSLNMGIQVMTLMVQHKDKGQQ